MTGTLYGVGVGPGDPELLTLKALRVLRAVPVIAYPAPLQGEGLARSIVAGHLPGGQVEIVLRMSFDHAEPRPDAAYDRGAAAVAGHLADGRDVAVLCEGDPLFFGSFIYLLTRLAGTCPAVVIPGIASPMACAAAVPMPLAAGDDPVVIIPATLADDAVEALLRPAASVVIMKLGRHLPRIAALLERLGVADRTTIVAHATRPDQRVMTLAEALAQGAPYFSMALVRK